MQIIRDISELTPTAQQACKAFLYKCKQQGLKVRITETYRSQERQDELYAQGRTKPGKIVTWTHNSRHKSRLAWDICQDIKGKEYSDNNFFKACGAIAKELNITWGGTWNTPDMPHFEVTAVWTAPQKEEEKMTLAEKQAFEALEKEIQELKDKSERIYHYTTELPDWGRSTIQKLLDKKLYAGASEADLNLPETLLRVLVINDRAGLYK